jgi:RHS repeat-associated protein
LGIGYMDANGMRDIVLYPMPNTSGTSGLQPSVWTVGQGHTLPGLLQSVTSSTGATTTIQYQTAAQQGLVVPVPMWVVSQLSTTNGLTGPQGVQLTHSYQYAGPVYDTRERTFVGFRSVTDVESGAPMPAGSVVTTSYFATDACAATPGSSSCVTGADYSYYHGLRGLPVASVTGLGSTATPSTYLASKWNEYRWYPLYSGLDGRKVIQRTLYRDHNYVWDTNSGVSTVSEYFLDQYASGAYALGTGPSVAVPLPAGAPELRHEYDYDTFDNLSVTIDSGAIGNDTNPIATQSTWQLPPGDTTGWSYRAVDVRTFYQDPKSGGSVGPVREQMFSYDNFGNRRTTSGVLSGSTPLQRANPTGGQEAPPPPSLPGVIQFESISYDGYGNVISIQEPMPDGSPGGRCTQVVYDALFSQLPTSVTQYLNGCGDPNPPTVSSMQYDRGLEKVTFEALPALATASPAIKRMSYDAFGRLQEVDQPDPYTASATTAAYALHVDYVDSGLVRQVHFVTVDGQYQSPFYAHHYKYLDAFGDTLASLDESGPTVGPSAQCGAGLQWTVSGAHTRFSNGQVQAVYKPFFFCGAPSGFDPTASATFPSSVRTFIYDGLGRVTQAADFYGRATTYSQHPLSVVTQDPEQQSGGLHAGASTTVTRDGHGRVVQTAHHYVDPGAVDMYVNTTYQATGEPLTITQQSGGHSAMRTMGYDTLGRMVLNTEPNVGTWSYAYDALGRLIATADARGCGENIQHDNFGRVVSEDYSPCTTNQAAYTPIASNGDGSEAYYTYDAYGRPQTVSDRAQTSTYSYDNRGRPILIAKQIAVPMPPLGGSLTGRYAPATYDKQMAYLESGRVSQTSLSPTAISEPQTSVQAIYTYDGLIQQVSGGVGMLLANQTFDASGNATQRVYGDAAGTTAFMTYGNNEELQSYGVQRNQGPWASVTGAAPYNLENTLTSLVLRYDGAGNVLRLLDSAAPPSGSSWPSGSSPASHVMTYYSDYRLQSVATAYGVQNDSNVSPYLSGEPYPVQNAAVTTRATTRSYSYDYRGNMTSSTDNTSDFYDRSLGAITNGPKAPDQFSQASLAGSAGGSASASYDAAGNMTSLVVSRQTNPPKNSYQYFWDEVGRLASASRTDISSTGSSVYTVTDTFAYDAGGARVRTSRSDTATNTTTHTIQIFDSLVLRNAPFATGGSYADNYWTEELYLGIGGMMLGHAVYDAASDLPVVSSGPNGRLHVYMPLGDPLGSTSNVIDHDSGELVERPAYQPYGAVDTDYRSSRWQNHREDVRYTSHWDNAEVGLIYFGARYYNPQLGRWISPDPLTIHGLGADANPYAFVRGSPMGNVDPLGLDTSGCTDGSANCTGEGGTIGGAAGCAVGALIGAGAGCLPGSIIGSGVGLLAGWLSSGQAGNDVNRFIDGLKKTHIDLDPHWNININVNLGCMFACGGSPVDMSQWGKTKWAQQGWQQAKLAAPWVSPPIGATWAAIQQMRTVFDASASTGSRMMAGVALGASFLPGLGELGLVGDAAEGVGGAAEQTISVFHGSINNGAEILQNGLDAARAPTFVSRDIAAAQDVLANHPDAVPGLGQIIESRIPASQFNRLLAPFERPYGGFYPYGLQSTEIPLRSVEQIELFNQFMVGF